MPRKHSIDFLNDVSAKSRKTCGVKYVKHMDDLINYCFRAVDVNLKSEDAKK